jgi:hypothetical protein
MRHQRHTKKNNKKKLRSVEKGGKFIIYFFYSLFFFFSSFSVHFLWLSTYINTFFWKYYGLQKLIFIIQMLTCAECTINVTKDLNVNYLLEHGLVLKRKQKPFSLAGGNGLNIRILFGKTLSNFETIKKKSF